VWESGGKVYVRTGGKTVEIKDAPAAASGLPATRPSWTLTTNNQGAVGGIPGTFYIENNGTRMQVNAVDSAGVDHTDEFHVIKGDPLDIWVDGVKHTVTVGADTNGDHRDWTLAGTGNDPIGHYLDLYFDTVLPDAVRNAKVIELSGGWAQKPITGAADGNVLTLAGGKPAWGPVSVDHPTELPAVPGTHGQWTVQVKPANAPAFGAAPDPGFCWIDTSNVTFAKTDLSGRTFTDSELDAIRTWTLQPEGGALFTTTEDGGASYGTAYFILHATTPPSVPTIAAGTKVTMTDGKSPTGQVLTLDAAGKPAWKPLPDAPSGLPSLDQPAATLSYKWNYTAGVGQSGMVGVDAISPTKLQFNSFDAVGFGNKHDAVFQALKAGDVVRVTQGANVGTFTLSGPAVKTGSGWDLPLTGATGTFVNMVPNDPVTVAIGSVHAAEGDVLTIVKDTPTWQAPSGGGMPDNPRDMPLLVWDATAKAWTPALRINHAITVQPKDGEAAVEVQDYNITIGADGGNRDTAKIILDKRRIQLNVEGGGKAFMGEITPDGAYLDTQMTTGIVKLSTNPRDLPATMENGMIWSPKSGPDTGTIYARSGGQTVAIGPWVGTAAEYAALTTKDPTRLYIVTGA
jgi:hypothetical protein